MTNRLFWLATESTPSGGVFTCPQCGRNIHAAVFRRPDRGSEFFGDGDFVAPCRYCGRRRKWHLGDAVPAQVKRRFGRPFQSQFCAAVSRGLPLASLGASVYAGLAQPGEVADLLLPDIHCGRTRNLVGHQLMLGSGDRRVVLLPASARIEVRVGQELAPGERWCLAVSATGRWGRANLSERWRGLAEVLGGAPYAGPLQQAWFEQELVILPEHPEIVLCRSDLMAAAAARLDLNPLGLWWDIRPLARHLDGVLEAAVLPFLPLSRWDDLRLSVADVIVDASIADPRVRSRPSKRVTTTVRPSRTRAA